MPRRNTSRRLYLVMSSVLPACSPGDLSIQTETDSEAQETSATESWNEPTTSFELCGDGICDPGEVLTCAQDCPIPPACGDGVEDPGEACDDGNQDNDDGCLVACVLPSCGDGFVQAGVETCDDGQNNSDDYTFVEHCGSMCRGSAPHCGDTVCQLVNENANICPYDCPPNCGNGFVEGDEQCDDGDDGTPANSADCDDDCTKVDCGDGFVNSAAGETCDDVNDDDTDACVMCREATCGDGAVQAGVEECDDANDADDDACSNTCELPRRVFITSTVYNGNLGGLAGADAKCQARAEEASLGGTFKVWISDTDTAPADRFDTSFTGAYQLVDGSTIAVGWTDLTDGSLDHPIDLTELDDAMPVDSLSWSNTTPDGEPLGALHCLDWTTAAAAAKGSIGFTATGDSTWTDAMDDAPCSALSPIYCFEDPA